MDLLGFRSALVEYERQSNEWDLDALHPNTDSGIEGRLIGPAGVGIAETLHRVHAPLNGFVPVAVLRSCHFLLLLA